MGSGGRDEGAPARRELEGIYLLETAYGSGAGWDKLMAGLPVDIVRMARQEHAMKRLE